MLFNDDILFVHAPKTGGMSVTQYLINNLNGQIHLFVDEKSFNHARSTIRMPDVEDRLNLHVGGRHSRLKTAAEKALAVGRPLESFKAVLAVIRNPYDLEVSHYSHLRKPKVRNGPGAAARDVVLARAGDFERFAIEAPYFKHFPSHIEEYYQIDGETPDNLTFVRFENLADNVRTAISPFADERFPMPVNNRSSRPDYQDLLTPAAEQGIFEKYEFLFNFYPREIGSATAVRSA